MGSEIGPRMAVKRTTHPGVQNDAHVLDSNMGIMPRLSVSDFREKLD
jgi:hypothetical protein